VIKTAFEKKIGNFVFDNLPAFQNGIFQPHLKIVDFPKANETVYQSGDDIDFLYFPIDCIFSTVALMEDGASVEISFAGNKSFLGSAALFNSPSAHFWTSIMVTGSALRMDCGILQGIINENAPIREFLMQFYLSSLTQISQRAICHGKHHLLQCFSSWLLMLFDQSPLDSLPLTHDVIAQKLGARRAGITSAAGKLQALEAIHYSRGMIRILNRELIEKEACECYRLSK
jgi:CRP-like cAMP-binding protein